MGDLGANPQTSDATTTNNDQVGVQGGTEGSVTLATGASSSNAINITSSDPAVVTTALNFGAQALNDNSIVATSAIIASQASTNSALAALEDVENNATTTTNTALAAAANTATAALQYGAGQPIQQAISTSPFSSLSTTQIVIGILGLLVTVYFLARNK